MNINIFKSEPDCVDPSLNEDSGLAAAYDLVLEHGDSFDDLTPESRTDLSRSDSLSFDESRPMLPAVSQAFLRQDSAMPSSTLHYGGGGGSTGTYLPASCIPPDPLSTPIPSDNYCFELAPFSQIIGEHDHGTFDQHPQWTSADSETVRNCWTPIVAASAPIDNSQLSLSVNVNVPSNRVVAKPNSERPKQSYGVPGRHPNRKTGTTNCESRVRRLAVTQSPTVTQHHTAPLVPAASTNGVTPDPSINGATPGPSTFSPALCVICGDTASGRHYGVISCEGCKGFFKRSVRKQLQFTCRGSGHCPVDRSKRTRCQHCRLEQCLSKGMRREAVQEERHRYFQKETKGRSQQLKVEHSITVSVDGHSTKTNGHTLSLVEHGKSTVICSPQSSDPTPVIERQSGRKHRSNRATTSTTSVICSPTEPAASTIVPPPLSLTSLLTAELSTDAELPTTATGERVYVDIGEDGLDPLVVVCHSVEEQLTRLVCWARQLPVFSQPYFSKDDQLWLLRAAWPELLLISASFNSIAVRDGLLLANGRHLSRMKARQHGLGPLMDRFLLELVSRFREMNLERIELALLRAIILFNPDANNVSARPHVESVRESLYAGLHSYCTTTHPNDTSRFTKLLLRLPPLRSIAQKCLEHLVFVKLAAEDPSARRLINLVEHGVWPNDNGVFCTEQQQQQHHHHHDQQHRHQQPTTGAPHKQPAEPSTSAGPSDSSTFPRCAWPSQGIRNHPVPGTLLPHVTTVTHHSSPRDPLCLGVNNDRSSQISSRTFVPSTHGRDSSNGNSTIKPEVDVLSQLAPNIYGME